MKIELLSRGVHKAPYLVGGWPALIAIDSKHWARKHVKLLKHVDEPRAWLALWEWLGEIDGPPPLRLVDANDPLEPSPLVHPSHRESHVDFALRMARLNAHKFHRLMNEG